MDSLRDYYNEGYDAYQCGDTDIPPDYVQADGPDAEELWLEGWNQAQEEAHPY